MALIAGLIIADRYALQDQLGVGAMGEVWRAQDTRFEARSVAVKFLREDQVLKDDAENRERLLTRLRQQSTRGPLTAPDVYDAIGGALATGNPDGLRQRIAARFGEGAIELADVVTLFDGLAADPAFNENARMRARLRRLFRDEANAVANLRHDNIVSIFDYGDHEGSPYLVMDYIEGRTLQQVIQGQEPLSQVRRLRLMEDLCAGLGYAHKRKLVHRDIKPANLIIDSGTQRLKILDFGVVRRLGTESTVGIPIGTFCYMSPEQTRGAATLDERSDIFAVGLVFYEILSGKKAFPPGRGVGDLIIRIQRSAPTPLHELVPGISQALQDIIDRAIAKQPEQRYQDLALMANDIGKLRARIEAEDTSARKAIDLSDVTIVSPRASKAQPRDNQPTILPTPTPTPPAPPPPAPEPSPAPVRGGGETIQMKVPTLRPPMNVLNRRDPAPVPAPPAAPPRTPPAVIPAAVVPPPPPPPTPLPSQAVPEPVVPALPPAVVPALPPPLPADAKGAAPPKTAPRRNPMVLAGIVAAAVVLAVVAAIVLQQRSANPPENAAVTNPPAPGGTPAAPGTAAPAPATPAESAAPVDTAAVNPPPPASMRSVAIDIRPWARVRIVPAASVAGQPLPQVPAEPLFAPFTVDLAPGEYILECDNGGVTRATTYSLKVDVAEGRIQYFTRTMPGFNAVKIVDALLGQD